MPRFKTIIRRARFVYSPYTANEMQGFAQVLAESIRARIQSRQNIYDQAAAPLKPGLPGHRGYPDHESARGLNSTVTGPGTPDRATWQRASRSAATTIPSATTPKGGGGVIRVDGKFLSILTDEDSEPVS